MIEVIPIVNKQKNNQLKQIVMRLLLEEYEQGKSNFYIYEKKEKWMNERISKLFSGSSEDLKNKMKL